MVVIEYENGDKYDGEVQAEMKHGRGILHYKNGGKYDGQWVDDKRHGHGENTWANEDRYVGNWKENQRHGEGTMFYHNKGKYVGEWAKDRRHGHGSNRWPNGLRYEGCWENNLQHGHGVMKYPDGGKYDGEWMAGKRCGYGINTWANGDKYEGQWKYNQQHGPGTLYKADGTVEQKVWKAENSAVALKNDKSGEGEASNGKVKLNIMWVDGKPALVMMMPRKKLSDDKNECPYFALAKEYILSLNWSKKFFNPSQDRCYCSNCYKAEWKDVIKAGGEDYVIPRGWVRLGLAVDSVVADIHDIWNKWIVTFHGTSLIAVESILTHRNFCWPGDVLIDGKKLKIRPGHIPGKNHVYTSPTIAYSSCRAYSPVYEFHSKENESKYQFQVVLQCRQMPKSFEIGPETIGAGDKEICPHIPNSRIEYYTDRRTSIMAYGLLIRFRQKDD